MIVLVYSSVCAILGSIVLALVPALRLTVLNVVVFVPGAFGGAVTFFYASNSPVLQFLKTQLRHILSSLFRCRSIWWNT